MIPGALPPSLDGGDLTTNAPTPDDDPEAAAMFAALVAQLLGPLTAEAEPAPTTTADTDAAPASTAPLTAPSIGVVPAPAAPTAPTAIELPQPVGEPSTRIDDADSVGVPVEPAAPAAAGVAAPIEVPRPVGEPSDRFGDAGSVRTTVPAIEGDPMTAPATVDESGEPTPAPTTEEATTGAPSESPRPDQVARPPRERHHLPEGPPAGWAVAPHEEGPARPVVSSRPDDAPTAPDAPAAPAALTVRNDATVPTPPVERPVTVEAPAAPSGARASMPTAELPVAEQVAARVTALDLGEDGRHELSLDLHPAELGGVGVDVVVDSGRVHVMVRADEPAATALLRDALDDLRRELAAAGLDVGDLAAHDRRRGDDRRDDGRRGGNAGGGHGHGPELTFTFPVRTTSTPDRGVDVLL